MKRYFDTLPDLKRKKVKIPKPPSAGEAKFARDLKAYGINMQAEVRFHPTRKWRFDFADGATGIAVEIEGGSWSGGRHTRGSGFRDDCEKYNAASEYGWRVFRYTTDMVNSGEAIDQIRRVLDIEV